jgi:hypothetical protein
VYKGLTSYFTSTVTASKKVKSGLHDNWLTGRTSRAPYSASILCDELCRSSLRLMRQLPMQLLQLFQFVGSRGGPCVLVLCIICYDFYSPCQRFWKVLVCFIAVNIRFLLTICNGGAWNGFLWLADVSCVTPCMLHNVLLVKLSTVCPEYFFSDFLQYKDYYCTLYLPSCPIDKNWSHSFPSAELGGHSPDAVIW